MLAKKVRLVPETGKEHHIDLESSTFDTAVAPTDGADQFTEILIRSAPGSITAAYFNYDNSVDFAVQLACIHTRRTKILVASQYRPINNVAGPRRYNVLMSEGKPEDLSSLISLINEHTDAAAVVVEPLGISVGLYGSKSIREELSAIEELCRKNGAVFIIDETQTFGGYIGDDLFVSNHFGLSPDIICLGQYCYGMYRSITLCGDYLKALIDNPVPAGESYDVCVINPKAVLALNSFSKDDKIVQSSLEAFGKGAQVLEEEFPSLRIQQVGFFLAVTRQNRQFLENWTKRICALSIERGLLVKNNLLKSVLFVASFTVKSDAIETSFKALSKVLRQAETELEQPSLLFGDIVKNGITPTLLTRIKKRPPVASQWEYVGALLAEINSTLFVRKIDAKEQASLVRSLRNIGIPAAEVAVMPDGCPEYAYLPGVSMDMYMVDHVESNPGLINGLVLRHQQYMETAHDSGLNIPDRWPGNTIVYDGELTLIDFDLVYCQSSGTNELLFAFEEVCATFQCVSWVMNLKLQQDISDRLCLAVTKRNSVKLISLVWKGMVKFYGNPLKPYLPESLTPDDYRKGIEAMNRSFAKLCADIIPK